VTQVKKANPDYTLTELCSLFQLKESTYYYQQSPSAMDNQTVQLLVNIKAIFAESDDTYGKRRIQKVLQGMGFSIGRYRVSSLMKHAGLKAKTPKKKHYYGDSGKVHKIAPNLLKRQFEQSTPNTHWVGDITYIRTHQGWSYLAAVLDLSSKQIVGYALSKKPNAQLAKDALTDALKKQSPNMPGLLFHSDQGVQYSAKKFIKQLEKLKITQSMSRRGNCWDNSVMERFFRSLKSEQLNDLSFINHDAVVDVVERYIHFYNYKRLHSVIGYITPAEKMQILKKQA
jgi:transposase InsO family protein